MILSLIAGHERSRTAPAEENEKSADGGDR